MNEKNEWTPGPWAKGRYGDLTGSNGKKVHVYDAGIGLAMCDPSAEDRANAALIAASPTLAEALHNSLALLKLFVSRDDDIARATLDQAEAALALARGETTK